MSYRKVYEHQNTEYRADAVSRLRADFPMGAEVRTVQTHVSSSGMTRVIKVLAIAPVLRTEPMGEKRIVDVSQDVARVLNWRVDSHGRGIEVTGCGMDMHFHLVYSLARVLYTSEESRSWHGTVTKSDAGYLLTNRPL